MKIHIISLFPDMFPSVFDVSMVWKAQSKNLIEFDYINLRDFGQGKRRSVDDTPYGGGDGMLLMVEPIVAAIEAVKAKDKAARVILPTPRGKLFKQSDAKRYAESQENLIIVCARYEGYDERVVGWVDDQYCLGNFIVTGGELPAMVMIDSIVRLIPGVLGGMHSVDFESFQKDDHTIEYPQFTRPEVFRGLSVPDVLLSGHHAEIAQWRQEQSEKHGTK